MEDNQFNLGFTGRQRLPLMRRLAAMAAPIAVDAGAILDDEELLDVARAVCDAFSYDDAVGGLTKAPIDTRRRARQRGCRRASRKQVTRPIRNREAPVIEVT